MSLKRKINFLLIAAFLLTTAMLYVVEKKIVAPSFAALEDREAIKNLYRGIDGLRRDTEHLSVFNNDWAGWDDSWNFIQGKNPGFIKANLQFNSFLNNRCDYQIYQNTEGKIVWAGGPDENTKEVVADDKFTDEVIHAPGVAPKLEIGAATSGLILTHRGLVQVSARAIVTSENKGPVAGVLYVARVFDQTEINTLSDRAQVNLKCWPLNAPGTSAQKALGAMEQLSLSSLKSGRAQIVRRDAARPDFLFAYALVPGVNGQPAMLLRADVPAEISAQGRIAGRVATLSILGGGMCVIIFLGAMFRRIVIDPLEKVTAHAHALGQNKDLTSKLDIKSGDEIGTLATEFNRMVDNLAESRSALMDAAHQAGMAEIAGEVLHNVGNALNTVNVARQSIEERFRASKISGLTKATALLAENKDRIADFLTNDVRGPKLVDYLIRISDAFAAEHAAQLDDLNTLHSRVEHINEVIAVQQTIAMQTEMVQHIDIKAAIEDSMRMHSELFARHEIEIVREIEDLPHLPVSKAKLVQILVNLLKNAMESIVDSKVTLRRITVRAHHLDEENISIEVGDSGGGVAKENLPRMFSNGFTTKMSGHGIGLHFCANAIRAMGGAITVKSDGLGCGATFCLRVPKTHKEAIV